MRNHPVGVPVRILKCVLLQQPVAALDAQISADEVPIASIASSEPRLFVAQRYLTHSSRDLDNVVKNLWSTFQRPINEGKFSYREDDFKPFHAGDLAFIERSLRENGA
jgi:hypothetical protein